MGWKIYDEAILVMQQRFRFFPKVFRWRGQRFEVETVARSWTVLKRGRGWERRFFHLRCSSGEFEIYQDIKLGTWHLRRAKLGPERITALRELQPAWR